VWQRNPNDWKRIALTGSVPTRERCGFFEGNAWSCAPPPRRRPRAAPTGNPLRYRKEGDNYGSSLLRAAPPQPRLVPQLKANPICSIEVGTDAVDVTATGGSPEERMRAIYARQAEEYPS